jgi:AAA15 family ATPase/GTPase
MTKDTLRFTNVRFHKFKGFKQFTLNLRDFNILVGPNNCGKSTILGAFRILAEGMRMANKKNPVMVEGPNGTSLGYSVDLSEIPVATENVFFNYEDSEPAVVVFKLSNGNEMILFFKEVGTCSLICRTENREIRNTSDFKAAFNAPISFVPILGPVEHDEALYQKEAARRALLTHRAARNFRNIWHHFPENFDEFRLLVQTTWPGMDIEPPKVDYTRSPRLHMFCPEERIPREIYWAGFGFQVWCQMLTYIIRGNRASIFLIDEPDIYLHSDLQRQLLGILRTLGPDILIATHSTEIITEAESDDLVIINKRKNSAKRISHPGELQGIFLTLGSNLNPILTQLAKTKRVIFVEGKDFQILSRFARRLGKDRIANRADFAVVAVEGFNQRKVKDFIGGIETTLGSKVKAGVIFDRDYRSYAECSEVKHDLEKVCDFAIIHDRKEIENFLLQPAALTRALEKRLFEKNTRAGKSAKIEIDIIAVLEKITTEMQYRVQARYLEKRKSFEHSKTSGLADETITEQLMKEYDAEWKVFERRLKMVPGKDTFAALNTYLQGQVGVTLTPTVVIDNFRREEIDSELVELFDSISKFIQKEET